MIHISERLRRIADSNSPFPPPEDMMHEAADRIDELEAVLRKMADFPAYDETGRPSGCGYFINLAHAVIGGKK